MDRAKWECTACTLSNEDHQMRCAVCDTPNPMYQAPPVASSAYTPGADSGWNCQVCTLNNRLDDVCCTACGESNPIYQEDLPEQEDFVFDASRGPSAYMPREQYESSARSFMNDEIRIVLIGRTGSGKSSTGNTILGGKFYKSEIGAASVTKKSKRGHATRFGRRVHVIDTPGLFDTGMTNALITKEIIKCIGMTSPGPHAIVLVTRVDRFTQEEQDTVAHFREVFGEGMTKYLFVLFTRQDDLDHAGKDIHTFVKSVPESLERLLNDCGRRYVGFNNRLPLPQKDDQVKKLLDLIDANIRNNGGKYYTNDLYKEAEQAMRRKEREIIDQAEKEKQMEREKLKKRFDMENAKRNRKHKQVFDQLQSRILQLEQEKKKSDVIEPKQPQAKQTEMDDLIRQVDLMKTELDSETKRKKQEHEDQMESLRRIEENARECSREKAREKARKEVEDEEGSALEEVWKGVKCIGRGLWKGFTSMF